MGLRIHILLVYDNAYFVVIIQSICKGLIGMQVNAMYAGLCLQFVCYLKHIVHLHSLGCSPVVIECLYAHVLAERFLADKCCVFSPLPWFYRGVSLQRFQM